MATADPHASTADALTGFSPATRSWFEASFAAPTPVQAQTWPVIQGGEHALVVAPTGSGKTLAAFLWSLDRLVTTGPPHDPRHRCRVLYISPLKALAVDVERNLRAPLAGIRHAARRLGVPPPDIRVGMRTGDTPAQERRALTRTPPDILITTPESLFLLLTSAAREALRAVETVIVDEVHAVCGTKRGAHLALSLERLDHLLPRPAQRIGLSATVRPIEEVARFLGGTRPVRVVAPATSKSVQLRVMAPVADMTRLNAAPLDALPSEPDTLPSEPSDNPPQGSDSDPRQASIWPAVERRIFELILRHRSTIVFVNSRRMAERLCARLNELAFQHAAAQGDGAGATAEAGTVAVDPARPSLPMPAAVMAQSAAAAGAPPVIARAHHGSVSRQERIHIEEQLKSGLLPAVVATSSLELGIDMGAVDLVIQVEPPPSVASGLQRIGRSGHHVGAVSRGVLFPRHRGELAPSAVIAERMAGGDIEQLRYPRNPLDVLAQQIVAMVAMDPWRVDELATLIRRAAPFGELPDSALEAVLDMVSGRYPSTAFAELRPRLIWDRHTGTLTARPGAQRLAVTSGGTIPDRGLFGVYLAGAERGARVGELDEEMVYESRVGDVFLLGSTSWRIEDITPDRVLVSPAPGAPARMPFWKGESPGRPVELGRAIGELLRELSQLEPEAARHRLTASGLDEPAADNLLNYLTEQRQSIRHLPDDRTIVVERFRDELGDWRLAVHCVLGAKVTAPWALAITARLQERYGVEAQTLPSDDGIVIRLPDTTDEPPGADVVIFDPEEITEVVERMIGTSALFASRFRECAARALLLPRRDPRRRQALWQQRQRAAQLLDIARQYPDFPITLEAARECLQDVFDLAGLVDLMNRIRVRSVRVVEAEPHKPSPFARSLLFGYVGAFLYEGDAPLAERRAAALALDPTLLSELLGRAELRELIAPEIMAEVERQLQWLTPQRCPRDLEDAVELLRVVGDLTEDEAAERGVPAAWLVELAQSRRAVQVRIAGQERWIAIEDVGRVRDALGVAPPPGVADAYLSPTADPLGDLIGRYARVHGPFTASQCAARFGLPVEVVEAALRRLSATGRVLAGEYTPAQTGTEWCDADVLRLLRRRSLAALRREIEPVPPKALVSFLPDWHHISDQAFGEEALLRAVDQLQGYALPASTLERLVLPARVFDYTPALLDELTTSGEVLWAGRGALAGGDGWISLVYADTASLLLPPPDDTLPLTPPHQAVLEALSEGQALFFRALSNRVVHLWQPVPDPELAAVIWDLVWAGYLSNDTLAPLRALINAGGVHRARPGPARSRYRRPGRPLLPARTGPPTVAGRWYRLPDRETDPTRRATALVDVLLERHGVLTRSAVAAEQPPGGFAAVYPVLSALEERGMVRRGYFVEGLGAAQFAAPGAVDRLRASERRYAMEHAADAVLPPWPEEVAAGQEEHGALRRSRQAQDGPSTVVLAATDPANPYGAALPWPERPTDDATGGGHRPGRKAGALVVLSEGELVLYVERGGRTILSYLDSSNPREAARLTAAARALAEAVRSGALEALSVERADGAPVTESALGRALQAAGFHLTPRGLRLRA